MTEISGSGVTEGMQVIVGERTADKDDEEAADSGTEQASNPFLPQAAQGQPAAARTAM